MATNSKGSQQKKEGKTFIAAWVPAGMKRRLQGIARRNRRSMSAQFEIFLEAGVNASEEGEY